MCGRTGNKMKCFNVGMSFLMGFLAFYNICMACFFEVNFIDEKYDKAKIHSNNTQLEKYGIDPSSGFPNLYVFWLLSLCIVKINDLFRQNYTMSIVMFMMNYIYKIEIVNLESTETVKNFNHIDMYVSLSASFICVFNIICNYIWNENVRDMENEYKYLE